MSIIETLRRLVTRGVIRPLIAPLALLAIVAGLAWWLVATTEGLVYAMRTAGRLAGAEIEYAGVRGRLLGPMHADRLSWRTESEHTELTAIEFDWGSLDALAFERRLEIRTLSIGTIAHRTTATSSATAAPPTDLSLPVRVHAPDVRVGEIRIGTPPTATTLRDLVLSIDVDSERWRIERMSITTPVGRIDAQGALAVAPPFGLEATATIEQRSGELGYTAHLTAGGELALMGLGIEATTEIGAARGSAVVTPFGPTTLERIELSTEAFDPRRVNPDWPSARLDAVLSGSLRNDERFVGTIGIVNRERGPVDAGRIPVVRLDATVDATEQRVDLPRITADLGTGRLDGRARYEQGTLTIDVAATDLDLAAIAAALQPTRLAGKLSARVARDAQSLVADVADRGLAFGVEATATAEAIDIARFTLRAGDGRIESSGRLELVAGRAFRAEGSVVAFDPSRLGAFPEASLNGTFRAEGAATDPPLGRIDFRIGESRVQNLRASGEGTVVFGERRLQSVDLGLAVGANTLRAKGALGSTDDHLDWTIDAPRTDELWNGLTGAVTAEGRATGAWDAFESTIRLSAAKLGYTDVVAADEITISGSAGPRGVRLDARIAGLATGGLTMDTVDAHIEGDPVRHTITIAGAGSSLSGRASGAGSLVDWQAWRGQVDELALTTPLEAVIGAPITVEATAEKVILGAFPAKVEGADLQVAKFSLDARGLQTAGAFSGLSVARLASDRVHGGTDLQLAGRWDVRAGDTLDGEVAVERSTGDLRFGWDGAERAVGLETLQATLTARANRLEIMAAAAGRDIGRLDARARTTASRRNGTWGVAGTAPVEGEATLSMESIGWVSALTGGVVEVDGTIAARMQLAGTVTNPRPTGTLRGTNLRIALPEDNLVLTRGDVDLVVDPRRVTIREARFAGDAGSVQATGWLPVDGTAGGEVRIELTALDPIADPRHVIRTSGSLVATMAARNILALRGRLRADEGAITLPDADAPRLGEDVIILHREKPGATKTRDASNAAFGIRADVTFDLGDRFNLRGRGVEAKLSGTVRVVLDERGSSRLFGTVSVDSGTVTAYGQQLRIERGTVTFNGPIENPQLNLFATRPGLPVKVGVQVTGFAEEPRATLYSDTAMTNNERLAWLVLGRSAENLTPAELAFLAAATATALQSGDSAPLQTRIAGALGLDEVAVRAAGAVESTVVAIGKRISDKLFVSVEQSVTGLGTALAIRYQFSPRWSLQGRTGLSNTVDLFYTVTFN